MLNKTLSISVKLMLAGSPLISFLPLAFPACWVLRASLFLHSKLTAVAAELLLPAKLHENEAKKPMLIVTVIKNQV